MFSTYSRKDVLAWASLQLKEAPLQIKEVKCEKTGTIYYKQGTKTAWSRQELEKSSKLVKK